MNYYGNIIARLNGDEIERDFKRYLGLVKKGIAGFIIFGGELEIFRKYILKLQGSSHLPLIIASDLEQGLGQQVRGGTLFPPAMALTSAIDPNDPLDIGLIKEVFGVYANESLYAGINTILAPVVDINTNPKNPIISARSFGEDKYTVVTMSSLMIEALQSCGVAPCAKHFPGHGDTSVDSHISLPVLNKSMGELQKIELYPFKSAFAKGVKTMMLGHISVPSIDPEGTPVSVSGKAVDYIRNGLGFNGLLMTDALNMGGLSSIGGNEAGAMALNAGVDILLHPDDPDGLNDYLKEKKASSNLKNVEEFRKTLSTGSDSEIDQKGNALLSAKITDRSLKKEGNIGDIRPSSVAVIKEDSNLSSGLFEDYLRECFPDIKCHEITVEGVPDMAVTGANVLTVIFSTASAWKGDLPQWVDNAITALKERTDLFIVFGNPYVVHGINKPKILTYWCSEQAEKAAVKKIHNLLDL